MNNWENINQSHVFDIGLDQFWEQTFENDGIFNIKDFVSRDDDFKNVRITDWD